MKKLLALGLFFLLSNCSTVPVTGRRQLSLLPASQLQQMSYTSYKQFLDTNKVVGNGSNVETVRRVGVRIQKAVETYMAQNNLTNQLEGFAWEFNVVESPQVNAWCMPGGKVVVYTGILPITQTETGLAVVMGHEIAHAIAKHGDERMSESLLANGLLQGGQIAAGANPKVINQLLLQAVGAGAQLTMLSHSRKQESEADRIGLIFMAMAGYNPSEAVPFWERMAAKSGGNKPPEFLSTHPSDERRIRDIQGLLPEASKYYSK
ncbi:MAG: M48 family metallopeptidase [Ferruginibacter sp.]|nr:M48 family metallopeptidase [Cytophagales bacterium]